MARYLRLNEQLFHLRTERAGPFPAHRSMNQPSTSLWYEIYPETSALGSQLRGAAGGVNTSGAPKMKKKETVIQLVAEGEEEKEDGNKSEDKPAAIKLKHEKQQVNPYLETMKSHREWACPTSMTLKVL